MYNIDYQEVGATDQKKKRSVQICQQETGDSKEGVLLVAESERSSGYGCTGKVGGMTRRARIGVSIS